MRQGILAALGALIAAAGLTGGLSIGVDGAEALSPETSGPDPLLERLPMLPPVSIPLPGPPLVLVDDTTRDVPEVFALSPQEDEPPGTEPDIQVAGESDVITPVIKPVITPPTDTGMGSDVEQWRGLVTSYFGDVGGVEVALCLMSFESGGNPGATNPSSGASGLMQVLPSWAEVFGVTRDALYDPDTNLNISRALYDDGGWGHWSPWNRGECH
jgi:Transglycosylase SLT domain